MIKKEKNDDSDDDDYKAMFEGLELGTEATRTGIIDNAKKIVIILLLKKGCIYYFTKWNLYD
ncbi:MAG: hypothetical protein L6U99_06350 [Clostridium sp.]|nr:MAG: hypothetical protein L6U99_06350 [Clostridium sp.]